MIQEQGFMSEKQFYHEMSVQGWSIGFCRLDGLGFSFYLKRGDVFIIPSKSTGFQTISKSVFNPYLNNGWILPPDIEYRVRADMTVSNVTSGDFYFLCSITGYYEHARRKALAARTEAQSSEAEA